MTTRAQPPIILRDDTMRARVLDLIARLDLSKPWEITVKPWRKKRTLSQNALYHKWLGEVVAMVAEHTGHDHDDIHDFCKRKFLKPRVVEINGEVHERYTTTDLETPEMSAYMDKVYGWATSELGLLLPLPEELHQRRAA